MRIDKKKKYGFWRALVRREVLVPEFYTEKHGHAWLDTLFTGTPDIHEIFGDISIRNPRASRYQPMAQREAGYCADKSRS